MPPGKRRGDNREQRRRNIVPAPLLIAGISSAERVPCFSSECRPLPEQGLHPAAEHGMLRPGQQRVAG